MKLNANKKIAIVGNGTTPMMRDLFSLLSNNSETICVNDNRDTLGQFASLGYGAINLSTLREKTEIDVIHHNNSRRIPEKS